MPPAWLPVLSLGGFFLISPAKNRFIDRRYQGVPDGAWLAAGLTSLCNRPAGTENPDGEEAFSRITLLWRNCFDNIGTRTWGQYHCFKLSSQEDFYAASQARWGFVMPFRIAWRRRSWVRITHLAMHPRRTRTGNLRQFGLDTG